MHARSLAIISSYAPSLTHFRGPLISALVQAGVRVFALAPDFTDESRARLRSLDAEPIDISMSRTGIAPIRDACDTIRLALCLRRLRPDATLGYFVKPVIYGSIASWLAGVPRRYSLITGLGYLFSSDDSSASGSRRRLRSLVLPLYRFALARNERVILQNSDDLQELSGLGVLDRARAVVIAGTGVDLDEYVPAPPVTSPITFLFMARLLKEKGVYEFVEAARALRIGYPESRFVVIGGTDENPFSISQAELEAWTREGIIEWPGHVNDVRPWLARASVVVLPSYYREGVPRGNQEAMAMARPVITTDWAGCRDTVIDGKTGFMVPIRSPGHVAAAMRRFLDQPALVESMGIAGRRLAEERFDVTRINRLFLKELGMA